MTKTWKYTMMATLLALLVVSTGCGGNPSAPETPVVVTPVATTVSLSALTADARNYVEKGTLSGDLGVFGGYQITRMEIRPTDPIRVYSEFNATDSQTALDFWSNLTGLKFTLVSNKATAEIKLNHADTGGEDACGEAHPNGSPLITGGEANIAIGFKTGCDPWATAIIATHELGHILGFKHTTEDTKLPEDKRDVMSAKPSNTIKALPYLSEAAKWIHGAPVGAKVVS